MDYLFHLENGGNKSDYVPRSLMCTEEQCGEDDN